MFLTCWQKNFLLAVLLDNLSKTVFKDELLEIGMKGVQNLEAAFAVVLQNRCFWKFCTCAGAAFVVKL